MKNVGEPWKYFITGTLALILFSLCIYTICYREIYDSINVSTVQTPIVEYGSANYDIDKLIKNVDGTIVSVKQDIRIEENLLGHKDESGIYGILDASNKGLKYYGFLENDKTRSARNCRTVGTGFRKI